MGTWVRHKGDDNRQVKVLRCSVSDDDYNAADSGGSIQGIYRQSWDARKFGQYLT
jgi:hypothetical protein